MRYLTGDRLFRLEYGEAHVAIRAGAAPEEPDNVVQPFQKLRVGALCASDSYIDAHGLPQRSRRSCESSLRRSRRSAKPRAVLYAGCATRVPKRRWLSRPPNDAHARRRCLRAPASVSVALAEARRHIRIWSRCIRRAPEWSAALWLVTHVDLHRTAKVQALLKFLKVRVRSAARLMRAAHAGASGDAAFSALVAGSFSLGSLAATISHLRR